MTESFRALERAADEGGVGDVAGTNGKRMALDGSEMAISRREGVEVDDGAELRRSASAGASSERSQRMRASDEPAPPVMISFMVLDGISPFGGKAGEFSSRTRWRGISYIILKNIGKRKVASQ